jgi:hypothetical protein
MTIEQATKAVQAVPNILSLRYTDSWKPNMWYYMQELKVSAEMSILTERNLEKYLMGTEASDVWAFAYLHTIGLQWSQLRIILDAFPPLTRFNTEAHWELRQNKGTKKTMDEFSLIFLRKRLQIGPRDVFMIIKVSRYNLFAARWANSYVGYQSKLTHALFPILPMPADTSTAVLVQGRTNAAKIGSLPR